MLSWNVWIVPKMGTYVSSAANDVPYDIIIVDRQRDEKARRNTATTRSSRFQHFFNIFPDNRDNPDLNYKVILDSKILKKSRFCG